MLMSSDVIALFLLMICVVSVYGAARDPDLYCSACRVVIDEVQHKISQVDPKKKIQVGSFRVDPTGNQGRYEVPFAKSESHLIEEFENLCSGLSNSYARSTDKETGKKKFLRTSSRNGEALSLTNIEMSADSRNQLNSMCHHLIEEHEEDFISILQKYEDSEVPEQACVNVAEACSVEDLLIPLVILADPKEEEDLDEQIENMKPTATAQPIKEGDEATTAPPIGEDDDAMVEPPSEEGVEEGAGDEPGQHEEL